MEGHLVFALKYEGINLTVLKHLFRFLQQNEGKLSPQARKKEFRRLTEEEIKYLEELYQNVFSNK